MWEYYNPVRIIFGAGAFAMTPEVLRGRSYALVTYPGAPFDAWAAELAKVAGPPVLMISDVAPSPDYAVLGAQSARFAALDAAPEVIVALGGGSAIDSAKVFAAAAGDFGSVVRYLETGEGGDALGTVPVIAIPTTAGTGSEVTSWATVWNVGKGRKFSLARASLYPEVALVDPSLMLGKPRELTRATGLDALSHALESIWNVNANPVSARHAVAAARALLRDLPPLLDDLGNEGLRSSVAEASLSAGLAFSSTKTAIAHNLSYPVTLNWGVQHGVACSFTLPSILASVDGIGGFREAALNEIFGKSLARGAVDLAEFLRRVGVAVGWEDHGIPSEAIGGIVDQAFAGERGRNFVGTKVRFIEAANRLGAMTLSHT
jgi:alcohol dehydrogenase